MSIEEKFGSTIPASKTEDGMEVELGERVIAHRGQARSIRQLGMVIANTDEGILKKKINVPAGILAVDEKYILNEMTRVDYSALNFGHRTGDNHLKVGKGCKAYAIASGVIFVQIPSELGDRAPRFETGIKPLDHNELNIPRSTCVHFNENAEVTIKYVPSGRPGRGGMGD